MINAGFFYCNIADRVICIYCNLVCERWLPWIDNPYELHKTISPNCKYVQAKLTDSKLLKIINPDPISLREDVIVDSTSSSHPCPLQPGEIVYAMENNSLYPDIPKRRATFATWPTENLPPIEDLVRAGFFYTGRQSYSDLFLL